MKMMMNRKEERTKEPMAFRLSPPPKKNNAELQKGRKLDRSGSRAAPTGLPPALTRFVFFPLLYSNPFTMVVLNVAWLNQLNTKNVILASTSPRRKEIMNHLAINYKIVATTFEENLDKALFPHPTDYVKENALQKALEVYNRLKVSYISRYNVSSSNNFFFLEIKYKPLANFDFFSSFLSVPGKR